MNKPCKGCPFSRRNPPGALGGSPPVVYVGQAAGPFMLHCHAAKGYSVEASANACPSLRPCMGAAIYRANTGVAPFLPPPLHREPENKDEVFATPAEFLAHHGRVPVAVAEHYLSEHPVAEHVSNAMQRSTHGQPIKIHIIPQ